MAKTTPPGQRDQEFAFYLAHGLACAEAARRAGYAASTAYSKASRLAKRPKIRALVEQYKASLSILDGGLLQRCLDSLVSIMEDSSSCEMARYRAANELIRLYRNYRKNPMSTDMARRFYHEERRSANPTDYIPAHTNAKS